MSLINGLSGLGTGLASFAGDTADALATKAPPVPLLSSGSPATPTPDALTPPAGPTGKPLDPDTIARAHQVYLGLTSRGMDPATAIGFTANIVQESGARPDV